LGSIPAIINAGNGGNGRRERANGSPGNDVDIPVPIGVTVVDSLTGRLLGDLDKPGQSLIVARGGNGGRGNNMAKPHEATKGEPGTRLKLILELKTIADIGLVGFPNAGKSSLLTMVSKATPRIAPYPFTTLAPFIGTLSTGVRVADLPGLVEEAHLNRGMGHEFLRHIERTKALLFVIDSSCQHWNPRSIESMGTIQSVLETLRHEISLYQNGELRNKPWGVVVNKCDYDSVDGFQDGGTTRSDNEQTLSKDLRSEELSLRLAEVDQLEKALFRVTDDTDILHGCRGVVATSCKNGIGRESLLNLVSRLLPRTDKTKNPNI
jgi:GTP-binding protein